MQQITIHLSDALFEELKLAADDTAELDELELCSPEDFARECVETVLAERRTARRERLTPA